MTLKLLPLFLAALVLSACSPYTNIPPANGDWASNSPNTRAVRSVSVKAIQKALEAEPFNGPYYVALPQRTTPETYALVTAALGGDALIPTNVPPMQVDENGKVIKDEISIQFDPIEEPVVGGDFPAVEIRSVYIRGAEAKVDVVRPSTSGRRLSTVDLVWEGAFGWAAVDIRAWRVDPDKLPQPATPPSQRPLQSQSAAQ